MLLSPYLVAPELVLRHSLRAVRSKDGDGNSFGVDIPAMSATAWSILVAFVLLYC